MEPEETTGCHSEGFQVSATLGQWEILCECFCSGCRGHSMREVALKLKLVSKELNHFGTLTLFKTLILLGCGKLAGSFYRYHLFWLVISHLVLHLISNKEVWYYQLVIKQLPDSCQEAIRKFIGTHQTLVRQSWGSRQTVKRSVHPVVMIKIWSKLDFDIHGWLTIENWLTWKWKKTKQLETSK